jgi:hypothetical protein
MIRRILLSVGRAFFCPVRHVVGSSSLELQIVLFELLLNCIFMADCVKLSLGRFNTVADPAN